MRSHRPSEPDRTAHIGAQESPPPASTSRRTAPHYAATPPGVSDQEYGGELAGSAVTMSSCPLGEFVRAVIMKEA
jgi:hypothetical protein